MITPGRIDPFPKPETKYNAPRNIECNKHDDQPDESWIVILKWEKAYRNQ